MAIDLINQYSPTPPGPGEKTPDIQPKTSEKTPDQAGFPAMGASVKEDGKKFGPDYVLEDSLKPKEVVGGVPFAHLAAAQTLAALPPIHPLSTAALTELSLQKMIQPRHKV